MKALVQRHRGLCKVTYEQKDYSFQGPGLVVLFGWTKLDEERLDLEKAEDWILDRIKNLRIFPDPSGKMNLNLTDYAQSIAARDFGFLCVPQFTLAARLESGYRPSFTEAMSPTLAKERFDWLCQRIEKSFPASKIYGSFGSDMTLEFSNWGPVTLLLEK